MLGNSVAFRDAENFGLGDMVSCFKSVLQSAIVATLQALAFEVVKRAVEDRMAIGAPESK